MTAPTPPSTSPPPNTTPPQQPVPKEEYPLCTCYQVWESNIERTVRRLGLTSIEEIQRATQAGCGCHTCWYELEEILARCARGEYRFPLEPNDTQSETTPDTPDTKPPNPTDTKGDSVS